MKQRCQIEMLQRKCFTNKSLYIVCVLIDFFWQFALVYLLKWTLSSLIVKELLNCCSHGLMPPKILSVKFKMEVRKPQVFLAFCPSARAHFYSKNMLHFTHFLKTEFSQKRIIFIEGESSQIRFCNQWFELCLITLLIVVLRHIIL